MATEPLYRTVKTFRRIEAIGMRGTNHGDYADPIALNVRVTRGSDLHDTVEELNIAQRNPRLRKLRLGHWMFQLDPTLLQPGQVYTVHWKFQMTPGNTNYSRDTFVWDPIPDQPYDLDGVVLFGRLTDAIGMPLPNQVIVLEDYVDYASLTARNSVTEIASDIFGNWQVELKKNQITRLVFSTVSKTVQMPDDTARVFFDDLCSYQARDVLVKDRYGYPMPGAVISEQLARQLTGEQCLLVQRQPAVVRFVTDHTTDDGGGTSKVEVVTRLQDSPSMVWTIVHDRDCYPVISVIDAGNALIQPDVTYPNRNTVVLSFGSMTAGRAILICALGGQDTLV